MLPKQENLKLARRLAVESLLQSDLPERAAKSGSRLEQGEGRETRITLNYLSQEIKVFFPRGEIEAQEPVPLREEIIILHYLGWAKGVPLSGQWISFAEISGGTFYHPVFLQRCKVPLVKFFAATPELIKAAAGQFQGRALAIGDVGIEIPALPLVPLALVLWRGDAEFSAEGNILFDSSIGDYLPVEDIVILTEAVVWKIIKAGNR